MENPLELSVPDDPIERIHALARDIAYGAAQKMWTPHFLVNLVDNEAEISDAGLNTGLNEKWQDFHNYYAVPLLVSFGYLERSSSNANLSREQAYFDLTAKAFALLERPIKPPKVFISYKQKQSSALALLIEARLKLADNDSDVFIDKLLEGGDSWEQTLNSRIHESKYFVCLIGPETLVVEADKKNMVQQEIEWALNSECRIIPIWHNGYVPDSNYPSRLETIQAIPVPTESAKGYGSAIDDLLVILGYSTI